MNTLYIFFVSSPKPGKAKMLVVRATSPDQAKALIANTLGDLVEALNTIPMVVDENDVLVISEKVAHTETFYINLGN